MRALPFLLSALYTAAVFVYAGVGLGAGDSLPRLAEANRDELVSFATVCVVLFGVSALVGLAVGFAGQQLWIRWGPAGGGVFVVMVLAGAITWTITGLFMSQHAPDPGDVGFLLTSWVWDRMGCAGTILYVFTVIFDLVIMGIYILVAAVARLIVPPAGFVCTAALVFALLLPMLVLLERRRALRGSPPR